MDGDLIYFVVVVEINSGACEIILLNIFPVWRSIPCQNLSTVTYFLFFGFFVP